MADQPTRNRCSSRVIVAEGTALLLGCGPVGIAAARYMGADRAFRRVIVADLDLARAAAAAEVCGIKADAAKLDCFDERSLRQILGDVALVVNTVRMSASRAIPLIRDVLEAGVSYVDASADTEALQAVYDSEYLDSLAGYRAVSAVIGLGSSPGLTNALTSYLGQRLERVDDASFYLVDDLRRCGRRQWRDRLLDFAATALVWRDGDWREILPMTEITEIPLSLSLGQVHCCTVGLGPVTLPTSVVSLNNVSSHRGFVDPDMLEIVHNLIEYGFGVDEPVETQAGAISPVEFASTLFSTGTNWLSAQPTSSGVLFGHRTPPGALVRQAQVAGLLKGRKTRFTMTYFFRGEEDAENTAATLVMGGRILLTREISSPGVHTPESLDPAPFLWDMERRGVEIQLVKTFDD